MGFCVPPAEHMDGILGVSCAVSGYWLMSGPQHPTKQLKSKLLNVYISVCIQFYSLIAIQPLNDITHSFLATLVSIRVHLLDVNLICKLCFVTFLRDVLDYNFFVYKREWNWKSSANQLKWQYVNVSFSTFC